MLQDDPCYVFGLELDGRGLGTTIKDVPEAGSVGVHWIHLDYSHDSIDGVLASLDLTEQVRESLTRIDTRPRAMVTDEGTLLVLRGINTNPGQDPEDMVSLRMWIEKNRLISVRQRKLLSVQDLKNELLNGSGPTNIEDLVVGIIGRLANRISDYVHQLETDLEELEGTFMVQRGLEVRKANSTLRREIAGVRRFLAPQRDALETLYAQSRASGHMSASYALREQIDRMTRYLEDLDLVKEKALVLQEEMMNISMEEQNSRMYALSLVAAVFLPISFVTGLFGMNVAGLPGIEEPAAFVMVAVAMVVVTVGILGYFKMNRWL